MTVKLNLSALLSRRKGSYLSLKTNLIYFLCIISRNNIRKNFVHTCLPFYSLVSTISLLTLRPQHPVLCLWNRIDLLRIRSRLWKSFISGSGSRQYLAQLFVLKNSNKILPFSMSEAALFPRKLASHS